MYKYYHNKQDLIEFACKYHLYNLGDFDTLDKYEVNTMMLETVRKIIKSDEYDLFLYDIYQYQNFKPGRVGYISKIWMTTLEGHKQWLDFFNFQGIPISNFLKNCANTLIHKKKPNTIKLYGPPGTGKSMLANALCRPWLTGTLSVHALGGTGSFALMNAAQKNVVLMEEPYFNEFTAREMLKLFNGDYFQTDVKNENYRTIPPTPIIVTTNHTKYGLGYLNCITEGAFKRRETQYNLSRPFQSSVRLEAAPLWDLIAQCM